MILLPRPFSLLSATAVVCFALMAPLAAQQDTTAQKSQDQAATQTSAQSAPDKAPAAALPDAPSTAKTGEAAQPAAPTKPGTNLAKDGGSKTRIPWCM